MISVGLPVVKTKYFEQALKSVLNQAFKDFELIIVDNKADSNIEDLINKYDDKRIKLYKNAEFLPIITNWNKVLSFAKGEYFVLSSDDDVMEPHFLNTLSELLENNKDVDIAHCRVKIIDNDNKLLGYTPFCPEREDNLNFVWHRIKGYRLQYVQDFMCRTKKLKEIGGFIDFPLAWGSDDATWYKLAENSDILYSKEVLSNWRYSEINLLRIGDFEKRVEA